MENNNIHDDSIINEASLKDNKANDHHNELIQVFKKERPLRKLNYDRPDGDDGKMIGSPITYGSKSKKFDKPTWQRYEGD